jgi:mRNA-degrading endonuclease HigB of HigAB toxin-antitoxin module
MDDYYYDDYDEYDDSHDYDQSQPDWNKLYFKFDITHSYLSNWFQKIVEKMFNDPHNIHNISGFDYVSLPANSWTTQNTENNNTFLYLGVNYQNQPIWKKKYFASDLIRELYMNHIKSHSKYFLQQPSYYNGIFDILN